MLACLGCGTDSASRQIISRDESYRRVLTAYKDAKSYYFLDYDGDEVVDAVRSFLSSPS